MFEVLDSCKGEQLFYVKEYNKLFIWDGVSLLTNEFDDSNKLTQIFDVDPNDPRHSKSFTFIDYFF